MSIYKFKGSYPEQLFSIIRPTWREKLKENELFGKPYCLCSSCSPIILIMLCKRTFYKYLLIKLYKIVGISAYTQQLMEEKHINYHSISGIQVNSAYQQSTIFHYHSISGIQVNSAYQDGWMKGFVKVTDMQ